MLCAREKVKSKKKTQKAKKNKKDKTMNYLGISGYLTKDAELKHIGNKQTPCVSFSIGHSRTFTNERGNSEKETSFFDITFFGKYAEIKHPRLKKALLCLSRGFYNKING